MKLPLKIVPGSSRDSIVGWLGDDLKIKVRAKAEQGKANAAVEKVLAHALSLPRKNVRIVAGMTASRKTVEITGIDTKELKEKMQAITPDQS